METVAPGRTEQNDATIKQYQEGQNALRSLIGSRLGFRNADYTSLPTPQQSSESLAPSSQPLPTDLEHATDFDTPPSSTSHSGVRSAIKTDSWQRLRADDEKFCRDYFQEKVIKSDWHPLIERLGGKSMVEKFVALEANAKSFFKESGKHFEDEPRPSKKRKIEPSEDESSWLSSRMKECCENEAKGAGRVYLDKGYECVGSDVDGGSEYWLNFLARAASDPPSPTSAAPFPPPTSSFFHYQRTPDQYLPKYRSYESSRKPDASLFPKVAKGPTIFNMRLNIEFTITEAPNFDTNPLTGGIQAKRKFQQAVMNAVDILKFQTTRSAVPSLSFHGKGTQTCVVFYILDHSKLEFSVLEDCFSVDALPTLAALLHLLQHASIYEVGYLPLFDYRFDLDDGGNKGHRKGDIVSAAAYLPPSTSSPSLASSSPPPTPNAASPTLDASPLDSEVRVILKPQILSPLSVNPFSRATVVLPGFLKDNKRVVVKLVFVFFAYQYREKRVMEVLQDDRLLQSYLTPLLHSFSAQAFDSTSSSTSTSTEPRTPEMYVFESPPAAKSIREASLADVFRAFERICLAIEDAAKRGVIHGDISLGNILLAADGTPKLIDWELGRYWGMPVLDTPPPLTGTLDVMSIANLEGGTLLATDDFESLCYVMAKLITTKVKVPSELETSWRSQVEVFHWNDSTFKNTFMAATRYSMWDQRPRSPILRIANLLKLAQKPTLARFLRELFALEPPPVLESSLRSDPFQSAVTKMLSDMVQKAISAKKKVDTSELE